MTPVCSFDSGDEAIVRIWERGLALFEVVSELSTEQLCTHPLDLPLYITATLLMTSDVAECHRRIQEVLSMCEAGQIENREILYTLPLAVEDYTTYTHDSEQTKAWLMRIEALLETEKALLNMRVTEEVLYLGAETVLMRLRSECGLPMQRVALAQKIAVFHTRYYDEARRLYRDAGGEISLLMTTMVSAFGFVEDEASPSIRAFLLDHAFELPREWYGFLYAALHNLEVEDAFSSCMIEGGTPPTTASAAHLSGIVALIRYLVGVDLAMLGRGIECAEPHMPSYIGYRLMLPTGRIYVCFEGEEMI